MPPLRKYIYERPWLLFALGPILIFLSSALQTSWYAGFLIHLDGGVGLASFEPIFIFPLVLLDYIILLCILSYYVWQKSSTLIITGLLFSFHLLSIFWLVSAGVEKYDFTDFGFRIIIGTLPSLILIVLFSLFVFLDKQENA